MILKYQQSSHSRVSHYIQCNCLYKKPQKVPQNNFDLALQQENCTDFCKQQYQVKISLILFLPFLLRDHKIEKKKKRKKKERNWDRDLLCSASQRLIIGLIMMSILPAGAWLWNCTGFVLPHPDGADGAWRGVDEQPPKCVPPPVSPHAERDTLTYMRTHTNPHTH